MTAAAAAAEIERVPFVIDGWKFQYGLAEICEIQGVLHGDDVITRAAEASCRAEFQVEKLTLRQGSRCMWAVVAESFFMIREREMVRNFVLWCAEHAL